MCGLVWEWLVWEGRKKREEGGNQTEKKKKALHQNNEGAYDLHLPKIICHITLISSFLKHSC